jgi:hypothetical protein
MIDRLIRFAEFCVHTDRRVPLHVLAQLDAYGIDISDYT